MLDRRCTSLFASLVYADLLSLYAVQNENMLLLEHSAIFLCLCYWRDGSKCESFVQMLEIFKFGVLGVQSDQHPHLDTL